MNQKDVLIGIIKQAQVEFLCGAGNDYRECLADHLLANGVIVAPCKEKKMVYFPFPIECENCSKVDTNIGVCKAMDLVYAGKHPKYSKDQDWDFIKTNCPHTITEREYEESDEQCIGKTVFLTKEEAEAKLKERESNDR